MTDRSELIEQIFQRVEEESARRAREEAEAEEAAAAAAAAAASQEREEAQDSVPPPSITATAAATGTVASVKQRRRGSVSVSRFGQPTELGSLDVVPPASASSNRPSRSPSFVVQKPTLYNIGGIIHHGSADSLASNASIEDPSKLVEDEHHSTQMATIAGKQSISRAISRRLSRARSRDVLVSRRNSVVIGVSVQEATVEHHLEEEEEEGGGESAASTVGGEGVVDMDKTRPRSRAAVYVGNNMPMSASPNGVLRKEKSSPGLNMGGMGEKQGWMSRAKDLTAKFKRKSIAALSQSAR